MDAVGTFIQWTTLLERNHYPATASLEKCPGVLLPGQATHLCEVTAQLKLARRAWRWASRGDKYFSGVGYSTMPYLFLNLLSFSLCSLTNCLPLKLPFPLPNTSSKLDSCLRLPTQASLRQEQTV